MKDTYKYVVCRINGDHKKKITRPYLKKLGYTKEQYLIEFPDAPLTCEATKDAYRQYALSDEGHEIRSETMIRLNRTDTEFQEKRLRGCLDFYQTEKGLIQKKAAARRATAQHRNGSLTDSVRNYFKTDYIGSENQKMRSRRMKENNPSLNPETVKKQKQSFMTNSKKGLHKNTYSRNVYESTSLTYQSSYEKHFLDYYVSANHSIEDIQNAPFLNDDEYPGHFYEPDYLYKDKYIIEIKSWYIANLQETQKSFDVLSEKKQLVERQGYQFIYLLDKNYIPFDQIK